MGTGELSSVVFEAELDGDWIAVPSGFPYGHWPDARSWALDVAAQAFEAGGEERDRFAAAALALTAERSPHVDQVVWYAPLDGGPMGVAFMTFAGRDPEVGAEGWVVLGITDSLTPAQVTRYPSQAFGQIVQSATTFRASSGPDDEARPVVGRSWLHAGQQPQVRTHRFEEDHSGLAHSHGTDTVGVVDAVRELMVEGEVQ